MLFTASMLVKDEELILAFECEDEAFVELAYDSQLLEILFFEAQPQLLLPLKNVAQ